MSENKIKYYLGANLQGLSINADLEWCEEQEEMFIWINPNEDISKYVQKLDVEKLKKEIEES